MRKSLIGLLVAFAASAMAFTEDQAENAPSKSGQGTDANTGQTGTSSSQFGRADDRAASTLETHHDLAKNEVTGKIVRADPNVVWIDHMGAVIQLKIDANTRFESAGVTRPKDLKEGQEIRASFKVQNKTTNVADSIWLEGATATGNQANPPGMETHRNATSPKSPTTLPEDKGTDPGAHPNGVK